MSQSYARRVYGEARVIAYTVMFSSVTYSVRVTEASLETENSLSLIPDFLTTFTHHFNEGKGESVLRWLDTPVATLLQRSWSENEENCFFEKIEGTHAALLTLTGVAVLIPLPMEDFFINK